ncbi:hypothetical protein [Lacticaseibacillus camelliae]|uniref:hypothetical protein n=1 Tax=Lacticaseibacillus camelliae TaxID=381742 RepID=UPI0006CFAC39|nr:hypothetical protein [Lacticaseibacillus camelliae]
MTTADAKPKTDGKCLELVQLGDRSQAKPEAAFPILTALAQAPGFSVRIAKRCRFQWLGCRRATACWNATTPPASWS